MTDDGAGPQAEVRRIQLDVSGIDADDAPALAQQIPPAATLPPRTRVVVLPAGVRRRPLLGRLLGDRKVPVSRAAACTALLLRGYADIGADDTGARGSA